MSIYISFGKDANLPFEERVFGNVEHVEYRLDLNSLFVVFKNRPCERYDLNDIIFFNVYQGS